MFVINKEIISFSKFESEKYKYLNILKSNNFKNKIAALCLSNPLDILSCFYALIEYESSVLLLPANTPLIQAKKTAEEAGAALLFHDNDKDGIILDGDIITDESSVFQFTSGTTGKPKVIKRLWKDIETEIQNYNNFLFSDSSEQPILMVPIFHSFGLIAGALSSINREVRPIIVTDKNPKFIAQIINENTNSIVYGVPFLYHVLISMLKDKIKFNKVLSSGSPLSNSLLSKLNEKSRMVIQQYGSSELGCISVSSNPVNCYDVGYSLDHLDILTGKSMNDPEEIKVTFKNSIILTNDLGFFDKEKRLNLLGRCDDLINISGQKVFPFEIEEIIYQFGNIKEAVVFSGDHPVWGESVTAYVVAGNTLNEKDIKSWCIKNLPPYKVPYKIKIVEEIPKPSSGKLSRKYLNRLEKNNG